MHGADEGLQAGPLPLGLRLAVGVFTQADAFGQVAPVLPEMVEMQNGGQDRLGVVGREQHALLGRAVDSIALDQ